jgi:hypothetical protein
MNFRAPAILLLAVWPSEATLVPRMSLDELCRQADRIVQGRIVASRVTWGPEHRLLWTHYDLTIEDALKGTFESRLTFSVPGGVLGPVAMPIAGTPHFLSGEHVIVFLRHTPVGYLCTVGFSQGCFRIAGDRVRSFENDSTGLSMAEFKRRVGSARGHREVH